MRQNKYNLVLYWMTPVMTGEWTQEEQIENFADHLIDEFYTSRRCTREDIIRLLDIGLKRHNTGERYK